MGQQTGQAGPLNTRIVVLEHVSLDGHLAGPNGEMDWIRLDDELWGHIQPIFDDANAAIFGRTTFQMMESYWPTAADQPNASAHDVHHGRWLNQAIKIVFTRTLQTSDWVQTRFVSGEVGEVMPALAEGDVSKMVLVGSASLAHQFLEAGLVDDFHLMLNPVVLGAGLALFESNTPKTNLRLVSATPFASGVIGLHYSRSSL